MNNTTSLTIVDNFIKEAFTKEELSFPNANCWTDIDKAIMDKIDQKCEGVEDDQVQDQYIEIILMSDIISQCIWDKIKYNRYVKACIAKGKLQPMRRPIAKKAPALATA